MLTCLFAAVPCCSSSSFLFLCAEAKTDYYARKRLILQDKNKSETHTLASFAAIFAQKLALWAWNQPEAPRFEASLPRRSGIVAHLFFIVVLDFPLDF